MFVEDTDFKRYPISRLLHYVSRRDGMISARFEGADEEVLVKSEEFNRELDDWIVQTFPAEPGTKLLRGGHFADPADDGDELDGMWRERIIGWAISAQHHTLPITAEGVVDDFAAIEFPNGEIEIPHMGSHASIGEFIASRKREREEAKRSKAG